MAVVDAMAPEQQGVLFIAEVDVLSFTVVDRSTDRPIVIGRQRLESLSVAPHIAAERGEA